MRRLRDKLQQYYAAEGQCDAVIIELPKGKYLPAFQHRQPVAEQYYTTCKRAGWSGFAAYEANLRARYLLGQMRTDSVRQAAALLERVLQHQPSFAEAYATLADCYRTFLVLEMMPPAEVVPKIRAACTEALKWDASSPEAHAAFAGVLAWEWKFEAAEREYELAIRLGPRNAAVHRRFAIHLAAIARFADAIDCANKACDLEPLSAACEHLRALVHYWARDFAAALDCVERVLAIAPQFGMAHHLFGFLCLHRGQYTEAIEALERATILSGASTFDRGYQAFGFGRAGEHGKARHILAELMTAVQHEYVAPLSFAHCYMGLGDFDEALTWVERAYLPGMSQWPYYLAAPFYEPLAHNKRFQAVLERIGVPRAVTAT
jgi:Tfp pilus assembly protein PilF